MTIANLENHSLQDNGSIDVTLPLPWHLPCNQHGGPLSFPSAPPQINGQGEIKYRP